MAVRYRTKDNRYRYIERQDRDILSLSANTYFVCTILSKNIYIYRRIYEETRREYEYAIDNGWKIGGLKCEGSSEVMKLYSVCSQVLSKNVTFT